MQIKQEIIGGQESTGVISVKTHNATRGNLEPCITVTFNHNGKLAPEPCRLSFTATKKELQDLIVQIGITEGHNREEDSR